MECKSEAVYLAEAVPPEMAASRIEAAMKSLIKNGFEPFAIVSVPATHGTTVVVSGKKNSA